MILDKHKLNKQKVFIYFAAKHVTVIVSICKYVKALESILDEDILSSLFSKLVIEEPVDYSHDQPNIKGMIWVRELIVKSVLV